MDNAVGVFNIAGTAYTSGTPVFTPGGVRIVYSCIFDCNFICRLCFMFRLVHVLEIAVSMYLSL